MTIGGTGEYRRGAQAVYDIKYHLIRITKYRYKVLRGRVAERVRDLIRQSCQAREPGRLVQSRNHGRHGLESH